PYHPKDMSDSRHVRRPAVDRSGFLETRRTALPGTRFSNAWRRTDPSPWHLLDQVRTWSGADDRPDEPLQHDAQRVLHGCKSSLAGPGAEARRDQADSRGVDVVQAAASDVGAVLWRRADHVTALSRRLPLREGDRLLLGAGGHQRSAVRARAGVRVS